MPRQQAVIEGETNETSPLRAILDALEDGRGLMKESFSEREAVRSSKT